MSSNYSRPLRDDDLVEHFLVKVLQFDHRITPRIIRQIVTSEKMLMDFKEEENTLVSTRHRDREFVNDMERWQISGTSYLSCFKKKRSNDQSI